MSSEKKQRLSSDIGLGYLLTFLIFTIIGAMVLLIQWEYLKDNAKADVNFVKKFLTSEFMEEEVQSPKDLFEDIETELPKIEGLSIGIGPDINSYNIGEMPDIELSYTDGIEVYKNYKYFVYNYAIPTYNHNSVKVTIVKDMSQEINFMIYQMKIYLAALILSLILVYGIYRHFYKKIMPQLSEIEKVTNSINIDNLNLKIEKKGYYEEFDNILSSYENMLLRLEKQTNAHIEFVHNASHELKTPIFVIKGYSDILAKWGLENKEISTEAIETIGKEIRNMQSLTEKLLFLAKEDSLKLQRETFRIDETIKEVKQELLYKYKAATIEVCVDSVEYTTDRELFKILLKNIIENAIKYGLDKPVKIENNYRNGMPIIYIKDNGIGMTKKDIDNIFTEFYRGDKSRNKDIGGHGLGMSIVQAVMGLLDLDINIYSTLDRGTTIEVLLKN